VFKKLLAEDLSSHKNYRKVRDPTTIKADKLYKNIFFIHS
jgi:hypothetical protein